MDFKSLNDTCRGEHFLKTKSWAKLKPGTNYKVSFMKEVATKYGLKIVATIDNEFEIFLPGKTSLILHEDQEKLKKMNEQASAGKLYIHYIEPGQYYKFEFINSL